MAEYDLFHKQTMSIMTLLIETVLDEIEKVFDCECRSSHTDISSDRDQILDMNEKQHRLVRLFSFCRYFECFLIISKRQKDNLFIKFFLCVAFNFKVRKHFICLIKAFSVFNNISNPASSKTEHFGGEEVQMNLSLCVIICCRQSSQL